MSYILDALRRAEAERERGQVPGLHARPAAATPPAAVRGRRWRVGVGIAAVLLALLGLVAYPLVRGPAGPATPTATAKSTLPPPAPDPAARPEPPPPAPAVPALLPQVVSAAAPRVPPVVAASPPGAASAVPPAAAAVRTLRLAELSVEQRRDWPPLAVGGSIWSEDAAQRFVILNGQVVHEGQVVAPGLVLERLSPKAAVLRWRDLRVELPL